MSSSMEKVLDRMKPLLEEMGIKEGIHTKLSLDEDAGIIRIYSESSDSIKRAQSGLSEVLELAYTAAEHHPYWSLLYHANEIAKTTLDRWESDLTADQVSEMSWRCDEIKMALDRLGDGH
ncbi:MAG TPA: hypothetical protein VIB07_08980 [Nitrososphaera sp.]